ncbi:potassium channel family protein [Natronolimnohabitans sp. A-GB9]|uniref:potassium channel family protein n=1 Tax=Natronolimnohabitans sp. A-GB9 TaxID=3069757 RepID=UPI0027B3C98C|nr:potassium channel family protein [Natronolimnohabitans sp. A-GB9]MDQ2049040.1 potassium channel family protein [Natronolimnohabitans sp. A-GB9]
MVVTVVNSVLLVTTFSLVYLVEHQAQLETFTSIPQTLWWGIITLTTVGYGDIYPVTAVGQLFGGLTAILGIGMFALPASILASGFIDEARSGKPCPHCGRHPDADSATNRTSHVQFDEHDD